jgi:hypothetical protein
MPRLGKATKTVTLSVHTKKLSLGLCRLMVSDTASCALSTIPSLLSPGLKINVRSCFGLTAIIPALLTLLPSDCKEIEKRESWSLEASTISIAGDPPPNGFGNRGLETKALNARPLRLAARGALYPLHETKQIKVIHTAKTVQAFFKPGTPKSFEG